MENEGVHVVFGAGQVGSFLAESLLESGVCVRVVKRSASGIPEGAEACLGDATDQAFCRQAVEGARLVVLENLYMLGVGSGGAIDEDTPMNPRSRKGEIRARLARTLFDAHKRGDVKAVSGRASDFYGPRGIGTHFAERFWTPALAGKPAEFLPNPETPHTYHFLRDRVCLQPET